MLNLKYFIIMAKKIKSQNAELTTAQTVTPVAEAKQEKTQAVAPKLILAQHKFGRWYVYFKGVAPKDNVGCGCKTARSAMRYMHLLKARHGAVISQNIYERLQFEAAKEAK